MPASDFSSARPAWLEVTDPQAARLLTNLVELRVLEPFFHSEQSVSELARGLGVPLDAVYFRVRRAERLGLLRVTSTEKRGGSSVKKYALSAGGFFVPQHVIPEVSFAELALQLDLFMEKQLFQTAHTLAHAEAHRGPFGLRFHLNGHGRLLVDAAYTPHEPFDYLRLKQSAVYSQWSEVHLTFDEAVALRAHLDELRRQQEGARGPQRYLLRLALAPLDW